MSVCKHCFNCRNYKSSFGTCPDGYIFISKNPDSCLGAYYGICEKGKNEIMKKWWENNGHLPQNKAEELPCYEATAFDSNLDNLLTLADKILNR